MKRFNTTRANNRANTRAKITAQIALSLALSVTAAVSYGQVTNPCPVTPPATGPTFDEDCDGHFTTMDLTLDQTLPLSTDGTKIKSQLINAFTTSKVSYAQTFTSGGGWRS